MTAYCQARDTIIDCINQNGIIATLIALRDRPPLALDGIVFDVLQAVVNTELKNFRKQAGYEYASHAHYVKINEMVKSAKEETDQKD